MIAGVDWGAISAFAAVVSLALVGGGAIATWWDRRRGGKESMRRQVRRMARYLFGEGPDEDINAPPEKGFGQRVDDFIGEQKEFNCKTEKFMANVKRELSVNGTPENSVKGAVGKMLQDVQRLTTTLCELVKDQRSKATS